VPLDAFGAGQRDQTIVTTLCPSGEERMERLIRLMRAHRVDLSPLITHFFTLDEIVEAYDLFESHRKGVLKVGIRVSS
jgi:alcohol dehydrogenase